VIGTQLALPLARANRDRQSNRRDHKDRGSAPPMAATSGEPVTLATAAGSSSSWPPGPPASPQPVRHPRRSHGLLPAL